MTLPSSSAFWLARHVHLCTTEAGVIFLDLKRDKYMGLSPARANALTTLVPGWPLLENSKSAAEVSQHEANALANSLVERGLLTRDASSGKAVSQPALEPLDLTWRYPEASARITTRDVITFLLAWLTAMLQLRRQTLDTIVTNVKSRKENHPWPVTDTDEIAGRVSVFRRIRSLVFTERDKCLLQALALTHFLANYRCFPTWVIGVRTDPFAAHSWVQLGGIVFDTTPESVCEYAPILTV